MNKLRDPYSTEIVKGLENFIYIGVIEMIEEYYKSHIKGDFINHINLEVIQYNSPAPTKIFKKGKIFYTYREGNDQFDQYNKNGICIGKNKLSEIGLYEGKTYKNPIKLNKYKLWIGSNYNELFTMHDLTKIIYFKWYGHNYGYSPKISNNELFLITKENICVYPIRRISENIIECYENYMTFIHNNKSFYEICVDNYYVYALCYDNIERIYSVLVFDRYTTNLIKNIKICDKKESSIFGIVRYVMLLNRNQIIISFSNYTNSIMVILDLNEGCQYIKKIDHLTYDMYIKHDKLYILGSNRGLYEYH